MVARPMFVACGRTLQPVLHPLRRAAYAGGGDHPFGLQGAQQDTPKVVEPQGDVVCALVPALRTTTPSCLRAVALACAASR